MKEEDVPRVAVITGASRGLGLALTRVLADRDWHLIVDARDAAALEGALRGLPTYGAVEAVAGDITDPRHRTALAAAVDRAGRLDAVVLNAGTLGPSPLPPLVDLVLDELDRTFHVNVTAQLALVQALLPRLPDGGRILAITSDAARESYAGWGAYGATKAALEQLMNVLVAEHPRLRIHRVDPGDVRTQMHQDAFPGEDISDRPEPDVAVPGLLRLLEEELPSGRWQAQELNLAPADTR